MIMELRDLTTAFAYGKAGQSVPVTGAIVIHMRAGNKGIDAFEPVNDTAFHQLIERPVDLQGRPEPVIPQAVKDRIGAQRSIRLCQGFKNQCLIFRS
jgi:hypothetical protein